MHKLSKNHESLVQLRKLKLERFMGYFLPHYVINGCAKWTPPFAVKKQGLEKAHETEGPRQIRLMVPYHPNLAAGLQKKVYELTETWRGILAMCFDPSKVRQIKIVYRGSGRAMHYIARNLKL